MVCSPHLPFQRKWTSWQWLDHVVVLCWRDVCLWGSLCRIIIIQYLNDKRFQFFVSKLAVIFTHKHTHLKTCILGTQCKYAQWGHTWLILWLQATMNTHTHTHIKTCILGTPWGLPFKVIDIRTLGNENKLQILVRCALLIYLFNGSGHLGSDWIM